MKTLAVFLCGFSIGATIVHLGTGASWAGFFVGLFMILLCVGLYLYALRSEQKAATS